MIDAYTRVLEAAAETGDEAVAEKAVEKLIAHLRSTGRMGILRDIARELRTIAVRRNALHPRVEVARKEDEHHALAEAKKLGLAATEAHVNPTLIRGWRAYGAGKLVDRSAKHDLIQIYQNVTH